MPPWAKILAAVLFAVLMGVAGVAVHAVVPGLHEWLIARIGHAGVDAALIIIVSAAGLYGWLGQRAAGRNPKGT